MEKFIEMIPLLVAILGLCGTLLKLFLPLMVEKVGRERAEKIAKSIETTLEVTRLAIELSEVMHKQKGQGKIKREDALAFIKSYKLPLELTDDQLRALIDSLVEVYNNTNWAKTISTETVGVEE